MTSPDLVLLHAPSIYDFRQETVLYGPLGDFVLPPFAVHRYPLAHGALAQIRAKHGFFPAGHARKM